jgi:hypothetical protein
MNLKADKKSWDAMKSFIVQNGLEIIEEREEQHGNQLKVKSGISVVSVNVYKTGKIVVGGPPDSALKKALEVAKTAIEAGNLSPDAVLPFEIESFPEKLKSRIPECDEVIVSFVREAIGCVKAGHLLATAFLIGASSEKAVHVLVEAYGDAIADEKHRNAFKDRAAKSKTISRKFDEFMASFKSCKTKPATPELATDLELILNSLFTFYRLTPNEVGHPQVVPNLDKGILLANMAQFLTYLTRIYGLVRFFKMTPVVI